MIRHVGSLRRYGSVWTGLRRTCASSRIIQQNRAFCSQEPADENLAKTQREALQVGRSLAKLSLMMQRAQAAIPETANQGALFPEVQVRLEEEIKEARSIIREALEKSGADCTVVELGDRINNNQVSISFEALNYKDLMRAEYLRDSFEETLFAFDILPPPEAWVDGSDKPLCRLERREQKRKSLAVNEKTDSQGSSEHASSSDVPESLIEDVSEEELLRRKTEMEAASSVQSVLSGFDTALLEVSRVHKVTKGGTTLSMRALVVIGDRKGCAGYGEGKSETTAHAVERACRDAKRNLLHIERMQDRTIHHRVRGKYVRSQVSLWPAPRGCGISANNNFTAIFQLFGIKDIGAKLHGPRSLTNAVKALFNALSRVQSRETIAATRGLHVLDVASSNPGIAGLRTRAMHQSQ